MRTLMWFRSDLRLADNTALHAAYKAASKGVAGVFVICPRQWATHDWGSMKVDFMLRNLAALSTALQSKRIPLKLLRCADFSDIPGKLLDLARTHDCQALFYNREHEVNELARDEAVDRCFTEAGLTARPCTDQVILDVENIRTGAGNWYTVFTPFKKKWLTMLGEQGLPDVHAPPRAQADLAIVPDPVPDELPGFTGHRRPDLWPAGERAARSRLKRFADQRIEQYEEARDCPAESGTSSLSPYLAAGVLSPRQCLEAAVVANDGQFQDGHPGITNWMSQLVWREFYRHILMGFPRISKHRAFRPQTETIQWCRDEALFASWCAGRTGFPIIDAAMRQLTETGWMHNRLRMITAMFLTKDLFIDWRWGERYFMQQLVDGDLANNNGGWQWSASTGTDAAPYFRIFNPFSQSRRFDPGGTFIRQFVPELRELSDRDIHAPHESGLDIPGYPQPIVDRTQTRDRVIAAFKALATAGSTK